jgi:hypothetical protein
MKRQIKLTSQQQQQPAPDQRAELQPGLEFATADEMLRHDAQHTPVPPAIAHRLAQSLAKMPPRSQSWWRRWFGK